MKIVILIYWLATTIYATYWLVKNPSNRTYEDPEYVSLLEILAKFFVCLILGPFFVPIALLSTIRFKR
jgi:hypothetical protein